MIVLTIDRSGTKLAVHFDYRADLVDRIKMIPGRVWKRPYWMVPLTEETVKEVEQIFAPYGKVMKDQLVMDFLNKKKTENQEIISWKQENVKLELDCGTTFVTEPFAHQVTALAMCQKRKNFGLFMEMGTGKTKVILDLLGNMMGAWPFLVVAPVAVVHNWRRQASIHQPALAKMSVCHGSPAQKKLALAAVQCGAAPGLVVNYESIWRMEDDFKKIKWRTMILDESPRIKHRGTQQAKAIMRLGQTVDRKYILTGTPSPNSPLELYNQIRFLDPTVFGSSWYAFRDRYAIMGGYGGYQVLGWKNLPELTRKLAQISFRVLKKDCLDLPPKLYQEERLAMDDAQKKVYKELAKELVTSVKGTDIVATVVLAKLTKLRQIALGFVYKPDGTAIALDKNPKLDRLAEMLPELVKEHKVVIWTSFREEVMMVTNLCQRLGISWVKLDGSTSAENRAKDNERFQTDPGLKVFISQQKAGGIGIDLFAADYCIFFSNDYSYEIRAQAEDRLHRQGQKNQVVYVDLIMKGTIESTIKRMLETKANLASSITPASVESLVYDEKEEF